MYSTTNSFLPTDTVGSPPTLNLQLYFKNLLFGGGTMSEPCNGFEPQNYLRDRCKKCFRLRSKHVETMEKNSTPSNKKAGENILPSTPSTSNDSPTKCPESLTTIAPSDDNEFSSTSITLPLPSFPASSDISSSNNNLPESPPKPNSHAEKKVKRRSWRDKNSNNITNNNDEGPDFDDATDSVSLSSYKTANSRGGMSSGKSMESVNSNMDCRSMVTAMSGSESMDFNVNDEDRAVTPTEASEFFEQNLSQLRLENARLQEQVNRLNDERQRWTGLKMNTKPNDDQTLEGMLQERLVEADNLIETYKEEIAVLRSRASDSYCDKLTVENEALKCDVQDLQQELEEMQDQYREEEIDEFRELQRELEQNAKNCRILQFKLRKSERQREQLQTEKNLIASKLMELQSPSDRFNQSNNDSNDYTLTEAIKANAIKATKDLGVRVRELESELRVAKEVSVRLHNELETAEDKRYKMEDEIFYYKEKVRELQTQNKWRETRNKAEQSSKRQSLELSDSASNGEEPNRELRDVLERETDLKDQLRFTEDDLRRTQGRLHDLENENEELMQKLIGLTEGNNIRTQGGIKQRPPMTRSVSKIPTALPKIEEQPRRNSVQEPKVEQAKNFRSSTDTNVVASKSLSKDSSKAEMKLSDAEVERDFEKLLSTINELRKSNNELQLQLKAFEGNEINSLAEVQAANREKALKIELRKEQEQRKELSSELAEYKQLIARSENNKLISMATKVEILSNQLAAVNDRSSTLHAKSVKDCSTNEKYADRLKLRCEDLEKQISELKAKETLKVTKPSADNQNSFPTADEIEHCLMMLASVDVTANRICKQLEKLDMTQKEERRRSLTKDNYAVVVADLANIMSELKMLNNVLETHKYLNNKNNANASPKSPVKETRTPKQDCQKCEDTGTTITAMKEEIEFYKKKNKELTNQILQTEDRWTAEIEKQNRDNHSKMQFLAEEFEQTKDKLREQMEIAESRSALAMEKDKSIEEANSKIALLTVETNEKRRQINMLEKEQKNLKEWEIKYKALENIYEKEKVKTDSEKVKIKAETNLLKRRTDEAVDELSKLRDGHQRREIMWNEERSKLEAEVSKLREEHKKSNGSGEPVVHSIPIRTINYRVTKMSNELSGIPELKQIIGENKQRISLLEKKNEQLEGEVLSLRSIKEQMETELNRNRQVWEREKDTLTHKTRQDEKIRNVEIDAVQQKFTSRMNIMEQTNKSLHTQLVQIRRERDYHREAITTYEQKLNEERKLLDSDRKKHFVLQQKFNDMEKKLAELTANAEKLSSELSLEKEAHKADKKLWKIEKSHFSKTNLETDSGDDADRDRRITKDALNAAENVQKQYAEYQKFYTKEVARLSNKLKEQNFELTAKENEFKRKANELTEQIKILEIDQKNLVKAKEMQTNAKELMQAEQVRLTQVVQQNEVVKLTRKYKLASIVEQLNSVSNTRSLQRNHDQDVVLCGVINQLNAMREDDHPNSLMTSEISEPDTLSQSSISIRSNPFGGVQSNLAYNRYGQFATMTQKNRSYSTESSTTWDSHLLDYTARSVSPVKKTTAYPEAPPNFILHKDRVVEYDKDGRLHYVPKSMARSVSYDKYGTINESGGIPMATSTDSFNNFDDDSSHSRMCSSGTNILYKIRREEFSKGTNPSVKSIARAFETMGQDKSQRRGFFSMRKSRSVDQDKRQPPTPAPIPQLNRNTSMNGIGETSAPPPSTLPRGGRNPFKNMGSKLVDKVRRSLSRSSRRDESQEKTPIPFIEEASGTSIIEEIAPMPIEKLPPKAVPLPPSTTVKMRTKVRRLNAEELSNKKKMPDGSS